MTSRLFIAVPVPSDAARTLVSDASAALASCPSRIVPPDDVHVTVRFLGDVDVARVDALIAAVRDAVASVPAFSFRPDGLRFGPPAGPPRMLWAAFAPEPRFDELCDAVRRAVEATLPGLAESHPPSAHATLARMRVADCAKLSAPVATASYPEFRVSECVLFGSRLTAGGAEHSRLATFPLAA